VSEGAASCGGFDFSAPLVSAPLASAPLAGASDELFATPQQTLAPEQSLPWEPASSAVAVSAAAEGDAVPHAHAGRSGRTLHAEGRAE
jgi:hypothetical protein